MSEHMDGNIIEVCISWKSKKLIPLWHLSAALTNTFRQQNTQGKYLGVLLNI